VAGVLCGLTIEGGPPMANTYRRRLSIKPVLFVG
jgi:hypothetical protein